MSVQINFNGKTYNSLDEMPPEARQAYEQAMALLADQDGNGLPDGTHVARFVVRKTDPPAVDPAPPPALVTLGADSVFTYEFIDTDIITTMTEEQTELVKANIPLGRLAQPEEVAPLVGVAHHDDLLLLVERGIQVEHHLLQAVGAHDVTVRLHLLRGALHQHPRILRGLLHLSGPGEPGE